MNNEFSLAFSSVTVTVSLAAIIPDTPIVSIAGSTLSEITTTTTSTTTTPTPTPLSTEPTKSSPDNSGGGATKNLKSMSDVNVKTSSSGSKNVAVIIGKHATTVNDIINDLKIDNSIVEINTKIPSPATLASTTISNKDEFKDNITDNCKNLSNDIISASTVDITTSKQTTTVPSPQNLKRDASPSTLVPFDGLKFEESSNNETKSKDGLKDWEESRLKELLEEAYSYKNPRDKENKSEAFLQLLKETENEKEDQSFTFPAITSRYTRNSSASSTSNSHHHHHHNHQYKQGGSLQDIIEAIRNESQLEFYPFGVGGQRTRNRHNHNSRQKKYSTTVSSRQREGGSLPSNVNVTTCGSLLASSSGAGADNSAVEQQSLFVNESYKTASNKQKRNVKAAAAAASASAKETDSEFSALLCGISKGAKTFSSDRAQTTKEHNNKSESSAATPSTKWAWSSGGSGGSTINNSNSTTTTTTTANSYSGGDCVIEVGEWMDIQQQQQILQSQADADMKGLHYYERLDNMNLRIPRANIISSAPGNANMAPANTHTFVDETVRFATMEQSSKSSSTLNTVGSSSGAAATNVSGTGGAGGDASGNTVLSNTVVSVDPATLCVGTLEYLPLNENYQSCKSLLGLNEKPNDTSPVAAVGSTMFSTTKTITRQFDENGNALHEMYQNNGTGCVIGSTSHTTSTVVGSGSSVSVGSNSGINTYTSGINTGGGQSQTKPKSKKKSQQDRNTKTVDVVSVAGYRGTDPVELLVKYIESTDDNANKQNDSKSGIGSGGGGGCGGGAGNTSNKFNDKEKKKERKKDKEKHKMKKSNSLEELRSGAKMEVDDLKRTAATTESNVMMRNKSKTNKNNSASTADINKNFTETGSKICNNTNTTNNAATVTGARKSERRSWGTEELHYLGGDMSNKSDEKLVCTKEQRSKHNKNKEKDNTTATIVTTTTTGDKEKIEKQLKDVKEKEKILISKNEKNLSESNKNEPEPEQQHQTAMIKSEKPTITTIIADKYEKFDKFEKRKKSDTLNTATTTINIINNNNITVSAAQAVTVVDILAVDSLVPETAEFHVVTKKKKTKKQQQRASLDDNTASYNFSNTTAIGNMPRTAPHNFLSTTATTLSTGTTNKSHSNNTANANYKYKHYNNNNISSATDNYNNANHHGTSYQQQQHHNHHHYHHHHHNHNQTKNDKSRRKSTSSVPPSEKSDSSDLDSVHSLPIESTSKSTTTTTIPSIVSKQKQRQKQNNQINTATSTTTKLKSSSVASKNIVATNAPIISYADIARFTRESASSAAAASTATTIAASVVTTIATSSGTIASANVALDKCVTVEATSINNVNSNEVNTVTSATSTNIVTAAVGATTAVVDESTSTSVVSNSNIANNAILTQKSNTKSKKSNKADFPELLSTTSTAIGTLTPVPTVAAPFMPNEVAVHVKPNTFKVISYSQSLTSSSPIAVVNNSSTSSSNINSSDATTTVTLNSNSANTSNKDNKEHQLKLEKQHRLKQPNLATTDNAKNELTNVPTIVNTTCTSTTQSSKQQTQQMLQKSKSVDHESGSNNKTYNFNSTNMDQQYPALQKTVKRHSATNVINMISPTNASLTPPVAAPATTTQFNFAAAAKQQFITNPGTIASAPVTNSLTNTNTIVFAAATVAIPTTTSAQPAATALKKSKEKSPPLSTTATITKENSEFSGPSATTTRKNKKEKQTATATLSPNTRKMVIDEIANSIVDSVEFGSSASIAQKASAATQTNSANATAAHSKVRGTLMSLGNTKSIVASTKPAKNSNSANVPGKNTTSNANTINNTVNGGTIQRPAVIILNDNRQAKMSSNDFTFGDFNEDEMKFFDDENATTNSDELSEVLTKTHNKSSNASTTISTLTATAVTKNYLNDSGTSSDVVNNISQHAVDVDMMLSTSADATSSPNTSLGATSHVGVVNQSNDSGIYATSITNNNAKTTTPATMSNAKLNTFLNATTVIGTEQQAQQTQQNITVAPATTNCPQLETCNDIEAAIIAAARAAAEQQQLHQHQSNFNYNNKNIQQYQNSYSTSSSFSSTTSVSIDTKYPSSATAAANESNFKNQHQIQPQHQRQQNYYNTHTSRRQHYDYDCEYNNQQHIRSRSSSSQCGFMIDDNVIQQEEQQQQLQQQQLTLSSTGTPAFVNKILPHKEIEIHYRPPTLTATLNTKQQNDVIVDFIGTAWEEVANSKVTKYYDGQ